jgi:hypothetical protein
MEIYESDSNGIWAHELLLNLFFRLRCDAVFLLPNLGFSMSHLIAKLKLVHTVRSPTDAHTLKF